MIHTTVHCREFFIVPGCGHKRVCRECLKNLCELAVKNKQFDQLVCPEVDCESRLEASAMMQLLPPETFSSWKKSYEIQLLEKRGAVYCPRCNESAIQTPVVPEDSGLGVCTRCEFPFCVDCMMPWHPGSRCISSSQRLRSIQRQISHLGSVASRSLAVIYMECR